MASPPPDGFLPSDTKLHPAFVAMWEEMLASASDHGVMPPPWVSAKDANGNAKGQFDGKVRLPLSLVAPSASSTYAAWMSDNVGKYSAIDSKQYWQSLNTETSVPKPSSSKQPLLHPWTSITAPGPYAVLHPLTGLCVAQTNPLEPAPSGTAPRDARDEQPSLFYCYATQDSKTTDADRGLYCPIPLPHGKYNDNCAGIWKSSTGKTAIDNCNDWLDDFYTKNPTVPRPIATICDPKNVDLGASCWEDNVTAFVASASTSSVAPTTCTYPYLLSDCTNSNEACSLFSEPYQAANTCVTRTNICGGCSGDSDCPTGEKCNSAGKCVPPCDPSVDTCGPGTKCVDGQCETKCGDHQYCTKDQKCCNGQTSTPQCIASTGTCPTNPCAKSNCNPTTSDHCNATTGTCECGDGPVCTHGNQCKFGGCVCGGGPACLGSEECLINQQTQTYTCGACSTKCTNGNQCTTDGGCVCGTGTGCTGDSQCEEGICKKVTPGGTPGSNTSTTTSKSHTTRNVVIAVVVTIVVVLAMVLGVYFGLKHKHAQHKALV